MSVRISAGKVLIKCQDYFLSHPDAQPAPGHSYKLTDGTLETYEDIAEVAFGKKGRELISLILYTELLGTCALFLILQKGALLSGSCNLVSRLCGFMCLHLRPLLSCLDSCIHLMQIMSSCSCNRVA